MSMDKDVLRLKRVDEAILRLKNLREKSIDSRDKLVLIAFLVWMYVVPFFGLVEKMPDDVRMWAWIMLFIWFFFLRTQRRLHAIGLQIAMMSDRLNAMTGTDTAIHVAAELEAQRRE